MSADDSYGQVPDRRKPEFKALVDEYYAPLYRFAMSLSRSESDASDLVQDVFLLWANKGHRLHDPSKAKAWLFTSLHRAFLQQRRRTVHFPQIEISIAEKELPTVPPAAVSDLDSESVLQLLARVDRQYQATVALFYLEDYTYEQIATVLELPLGTVKSRISRGLAQLRSLALRRVIRPLPGRREL